VAIPAHVPQWLEVSGMLIIWEKRLVFLATPKAGSTAIGSAFEPLANVAVRRPAELKHANLRTYRQHVEPWLHSVTEEKFFDHRADTRID